MPNNHLFASFIAISLFATPAVAADSDKDHVIDPMAENRSKASPEPSPASPDAPQATTSVSVQRPMAMGASQMGVAGLTPPGIMMSSAGKWMLGYRYSIDRMDGNLVGTRRISDTAVLSQFMASPTDMTMQMHMGSLMFAPTDKLTLMAMVPYVIKSMDHVMGMNERFREKTKGIGDVEVSATYSLYSRADLRHRLLVSLGASLPTGSINERMGSMRLEYPMQLGSGTWALRPGFVYLGQNAPWGWGAKMSAARQLGRNDNGYRLGNRTEVSIWGSRLVTRAISVSAGLNSEWRGNIRGADPLLDQTDEPTKDPRRQGGRRLDASLGMGLHPQTGPFRGNEFFLRLDAPVAQSLDGPQLQKRWGLQLDFQREF